MFESLTGGSEDLHILDDANNSAINFGNNLTAEVFPANIFIETDIDDVTRPAAVPWDAGADQVSVGDVVLHQAYGGIFVAGVLPPAYGVPGGSILPTAYAAEFL